MKSPIRIVHNKNRYWEVWYGGSHSGFDSIALGVIIGMLLFCVVLPILGMLVHLLRNINYGR